MNGVVEKFDNCENHQHELLVKVVILVETGNLFFDQSRKSLESRLLVIKVFSRAPHDFDFGWLGVFGGKVQGFSFSLRSLPLCVSPLKSLSFHGYSLARNSTLQAGFSSPSMSIVMM